MLFAYFKLASFLTDKIKLHRTAKSQIKNKIQVRNEQGESVWLPIIFLFLQGCPILG